MNNNPPLSTLREDEDAETALLSRESDISALKSALAVAHALVFLWSPPKAGTTTLLRQLSSSLGNQSNDRTDVVQASQLIASGATDRQFSVSPLFIDEAEDLRSNKDIDTLISIIEQRHSLGIKILVAGDARAYKALNSCPWASQMKDYRLKPVSRKQLATTLVRDKLNGLGLKISIPSAEKLCDRAASNLFLIQRLIDALHSNKKNSGAVDCDADIDTFLDESQQYLREFFDDLADRITLDDKAPFAILDIITGDLKESSSELMGLGIADQSGRSFVSHLYEEAMKERCTALKLAGRFTSKGNPIQAVEFYRIHLSRWTMSERERVESLKKALNVSVQARDPEAYVDFARQLTPLMARSDRLEWYDETLIPQVEQLLMPLSQADKSIVFDCLAGAVDSISRTGRCRIYLADVGWHRLICRSALGGGQEDIRKERISLTDKRWKISQVFGTKMFADVLDTQRAQDVNREIALRLHINSCWLFPIQVAAIHHEDQYWS